MFQIDRTTPRFADDGRIGAGGGWRTTGVSFNLSEEAFGQDDPVLLGLLADHRADKDDVVSANYCRVISRFSDLDPWHPDAAPLAFLFQRLRLQDPRVQPQFPSGVCRTIEGALVFAEPGGFAARGEALLNGHASARLTLRNYSESDLTALVNAPELLAAILYLELGVPTAHGGRQRSGQVLLALAENEGQSLQRLAVKDVLLTSQVLQALPALLRKLPELSLEGPEMPDWDEGQYDLVEVFASLQGSKLPIAELTLRGQLVNDDVLIALAQLKLPYLRKLDIGNNNAVTGVGLRALRRAGILDRSEKLCLGGGNGRESGLSGGTLCTQLLKSGTPSRLKHLILESCRDGNEIIRGLGQSSLLGQLIAFEAPHTPISYPGLNVLAKRFSQRLQLLSLEGQGINIVEWGDFLNSPVLKNVTSLALHANHSNISLHQILRLVSRAKHSDGLTALDLSRGWSGADSDKLTAESLAGRQLARLAHFDSGLASCTPIGFSPFRKVEPSLRNCMNHERENERWRHIVWQHLLSASRTFESKF